MLRDLFSNAEKADKKARMRSLKDLDRSAATLAAACKVVLDGSISDDNVRARLFNADGSEAEISGNGTRCVAASALIMLKQPQALTCRQVGPDGGAEQYKDRCGHRQRHGQDEVPASQDGECQRKIDGNGQCRDDHTERAAEAQEPPRDECGECQCDESPAEGSQLDHVLTGQQTVEKMQMRNDGRDGLPSRQ